MSSTELYKEAWKSFTDKMEELSHQRTKILSAISERLDRQRIKNLKEKLNVNNQND